MARKPPKPPKWKNSPAKELLRLDIIEKRVTEMMEPQTVYMMRPEFQLYVYKNFATNLGNLCKAVAANIARMQTDCEAYGHDLARIEQLEEGIEQPIMWHTSPACQLLKRDINEGKHLNMPPAFLHQTRPEYILFDLTVFRKHIHQEVDSRNKRALRFGKKQTRPRRVNL